MTFLIAATLDERHAVLLSSKLSFLIHEVADNTGESVLACVRHHSRAQTFSPQREQSEQRAEHRDAYHVLGTFVTMGRAKDHCRTGYSSVDVACNYSDLLLQISAKQNFFHESGQDAQ